MLKMHQIKSSIKFKILDLLKYIKYIKLNNFVYIKSLNKASIALRGAMKEVHNKITSHFEGVF